MPKGLKYRVWVNILESNGVTNPRNFRLRVATASKENMVKVLKEARVEFLFKKETPIVVLY